ncbi:MAG TPA: hypothetical protein PL001_00035, partial [Candidatus Kryptobacter bacterium]|nr:hypothetical protein [Candidatus Kryptobacter bacterium]
GDNACAVPAWHNQNDGRDSGDNACADFQGELSDTASCFLLTAHRRPDSFDVVSDALRPN